jgi:integrase
MRRSSAWARPGCVLRRSSTICACTMMIPESLGSERSAGPVGLSPGRRWSPCSRTCARDESDYSTGRSVQMSRSSAAAKSGPRSGELAPGRPTAQTVSVQQIVARRAELADLGHVAPHDLLRTAAGLLHRSVAADGSHHFDLLDIQEVLGHSDPATTMQSYLDPLDTGVLARAAVVRDQNPCPPRRGPRHSAP